MTPCPVSPYGRSKLQGEQYLQAELPSERWTIIRPPIVYGPRDRLLLPLFRAARLGFIPAPCSGRWRYSVIHVLDLVRGIAAAIEHDRAAGRTFFMSGDERQSQTELLASIAEAVATPARPIAVPMPLVCLAALAGTLQMHLTSSRATLSVLELPDVCTGDWTCSTEHAAKVLGFTARIGIREGLRQTALWYRDHKWLEG